MRTFAKTERRGQSPLNRNIRPLLPMLMLVLALALTATAQVGVYVVTQTFPHAGIFNMMFNVASRGVAFADLPYTCVRATVETKGDEAKKPNPGATKNE